VVDFPVYSLLEINRSIVAYF